MNNDVDPATCTVSSEPHVGGVLKWLLTGTRHEQSIDIVFTDFCWRVREAGFPIARGVLQLQTHHPQWLGTRIVWRTDMEAAEVQSIDYGVVQTDIYLNSPVAALRAGTQQVRLRLDTPPTPGEYPICTELRRDGLTDYVAWPLHFTLDRLHIVSYASDRPGGFTTEELAAFAELLPALALVIEVRFKNHLARRLLDTYVGPHAGEQILNGLTTRGSGVTITAAIAIFDLRGFTTFSDLWPRDDVIGLLNEYFDALSGPIEQHGGEILKFIGDGLLAIFPMDRPPACTNALMAVAGTRRSMAKLNERRLARGQDPLGFGVGVNVGEVMYGNIGTASRLDFTVIGPAVNAAARLEALTKQFGVSVLFSGAFVAQVDDRSFVRLGAFPLRGFGEPVDVFAFADERRAQDRSASTQPPSGPGLT